MAEWKTPALIVVDRDKPLGVLTEGYLLQVCMKSGGMALEGIKAADAMAAEWVIADVEDEIGFRLTTMLQCGIGCLPVVEDGRLVAMLFLRDLVQHRIDELSSELDALHEYLASLQNAIRD
jgi:IMP dehydrogenase